MKTRIVGFTAVVLAAFVTLKLGIHFASVQWQIAAMVARIEELQWNRMRAQTRVHFLRSELTRLSLLDLQEQNARDVAAKKRALGWSATSPPLIDRTAERLAVAEEMRTAEDTVKRVDAEIAVVESRLSRAKSWKAIITVME